MSSQLVRSRFAALWALPVVVAALLATSAATSDALGSKPVTNAATADPNRGAAQQMHGMYGRAVGSVAQAERVMDGKSTLNVIFHDVRFLGVDEPPAGFSAGDHFMIEGRLFNETHTKVVGRDSERCENGFTASTCELTLLIFGKGKIRVASSIFPPGDNVIPVTGGTGYFTGARGTLHVFFLPHEEQLYALQLVR